MLAIVTGASSGIGLALTRILISKGYQVIMVARDETKLEAAAREFGAMATCMSADLRDETGLRRLAKVLGQRKIDLAMHAAGILRITLKGVDSWADRQDCDRTNRQGTENFLDAILPHMECGGHLTVISSVAALVNFGYEFEAYADSKKGLADSVRARTVRFASMDVTITLAYPSIVVTPMIENLDTWPAVYSAFKHHTAERAAASILRDSERRREESFTTGTDRILIWIARRIPNLFGRLLRLWSRRFERKGRS